MASNNSYQLSARLPRPIAPDCNGDLRESGAPALTTTLDTALVHYDEPHSHVELGAYNAMLNTFYQQPAPAPMTTLDPGPQLPADAKDPLDVLFTDSKERSRDMPISPAPPRNETRAEQPAAKKRKSAPRKSVKGKPIEKKVSVACLRCRGRKQKCSGEKPECKLCLRFRHICVYVPGRRQLGQKTVKAAKKAPEHIKPPEPVETALPETPCLRAPRRRILPRPTAPAAEFEGSTTGLEAEPQYAELEGGSGELAPYPEEGRPHRGLGWGLGGLAPGLGKGPLYSDFTFSYENLDVGYEGDFQQDQPANPEFEGYPPVLSEPLPVLPQPGFPVRGSVESPTGTLPYMRQPSIVSEAATNWSNETVQHVHDPGMGFGSNDFHQVNPDNARHPSQNFDAETLRAYYANGIW